MENRMKSRMKHERVSVALHLDNHLIRSQGDE